MGSERPSSERNANSSEWEVRLEELGINLHANGATKAILSEIEGSIQELRETGADRIHLARALILLSDWYAHTGEENDRCRQSLEEADKFITRDSPMRIQLAQSAAWAEYLDKTGDRRGAIEWGLRGVDAAERLGSDVARVKTLANAGLIYWRADDLEMEAQYLSKAIALTPPEERSTKAGINYMTMGNIIAHAGVSEQAIGYFQKARDCYVAVGDNIGLCTACSALADMLGNSDLDASERYINEGLEATLESGNSRFILDLLIQKAGLLISRGAFEEAQATIDEVESRRAPDDIPSGIGPREARADLYRATGQFSRAEAELKSLLEILRKLGYARAVINTLDRLADLAEKQEDFKSYSNYLKERSTEDAKLTSAFLERRIELMNSEVENLRKERALETMNAQNEELERKALEKERELAIQTTSLAAQTELLSHFRDELRLIVREIDEPIVALKKIKEKLKALPCESIDWLKFEEQFISAHPEFRKTIMEKFPELTKQEVRVCQLLRVGLKSYEVGRLICVSERGVENHRFNIRKKLGIKTEQSLTNFLQSL